jgi:hypothetical protein
MIRISQSLTMWLKWLLWVPCHMGQVALFKTKLNTAKIYKCDVQYALFKTLFVLQWIFLQCVDILTSACFMYTQFKHESCMAL